MARSLETRSLARRPHLTETVDSDHHTVWRKEEVFPFPEFPLSVTYADPQSPHCLHTHHGFAELVLIYRGRGSHFTESDSHVVAAGDVFLVTGEQAHGYRDVDNLCLVNVMFDSKLVSARLPQIRKLPGYHALFLLEPRYRRQHNFDSRLRLNPNELARALTHVDGLVEEILDRAPGYEFMALAILMQLLGFLCRCYPKAHNPASHALVRIGTVLSHIETNYGEDITLDMLCEISQMPRRSFFRIFREATGVSPVEYLIRTRLSRACELLRLTRMSVTDIALATGFSDSNYFARQFRETLHTSPSEYRRDVTRHADVLTGER